MSRITVVDIQHKTFKKQLNGYDRNEVDAFLDELIETIEDEATARAALEAEIADLRERISHFKAMEESLQHTLVLAQRTADEVKANAHKEADLIKAEARMQAERQVADLSDRISESRREYQRALDTAAQAKSDLRSLLMSHLALIDRAPLPYEMRAAAFAAEAAPAPSATDPAPPAEPASAEAAPANDHAGPPLAGAPAVFMRNGTSHTLVT